MSTTKELLEQSKTLHEQAKAIYINPEATEEDFEQAKAMLADSKKFLARAEEVKNLEQVGLDLQEQMAEVKSGTDEQPENGTFRSAGHWLVEAWKMRPDKVHRTVAAGLRHPALKSGPTDDRLDPDTWTKIIGQSKVSAKQLVEGVGASGGFLVPTEFRPTLLSMQYEANPIRARATVIPMRRRSVLVPVLDQTGTAAGQTRQYGGVLARWTEEATEKQDTQPDFRQIELVAHKLALLTQASDELLADDAVGLVPLLSRLFGGAIEWESDWTFLRGTGAGQPLGVINAAATHVEPRQVAGTIGVVDIFNMVSHHIGNDPVWHITRAAMPTILNMSGPAGNPSYVWINNARDGMPMRLMGYPIFWTEKLPTLGTQGDILLASWENYYIGERQATTIEASIHFAFDDDITTWRAVHRVDGQPFLSQPITLADGVWQVSPFVILGDVTS